MVGLEEYSGASRFRLLLDAWRSLSGRIDPALSCMSMRTRSMYGLNGAIQSLLLRIQEKSFLDALESAMPQPPIFVLGFWRSGTTFLHELLCCDPRFGFPSTYACLNPAHFLLSERWIHPQRHRTVRRPMDDMRYSWSSPQEDEFALLALGAPSAYQALLVPSLMRDVNQLLTNDQNLWWDKFEYFLKLLTVQQGKPMILKSPTHGYRLAILQKKFPGAKYVVIERNPYEVFASNLKLWRILTGRYSLEQCSEHQLQQFILDAYVLHERIVSEAIRNSQPGLFAKIRYENLVVNPVEQISRLYQALNLGDLGTRSRLESYLDSTSNHRRNPLRLSPSQRDRVESAWGHIIQRKAYTWDANYIDSTEEVMAGTGSEDNVSNLF